MKIDVWSDLVCPFCYIGKRRLEKALEETGKAENTEIIFHSFELNPNSPKETPGNIHELLARKYGMTLEQAESSNQRVGDMARGEGLDYNFDTMKYTNTFDAHRLCHLAREEGKEKEFVELLMKSYFTEGKLISSHQVLSELAIEAGLPPHNVKNLLESDQYSDAVRQDEAEAQNRQISGVPYFIFNNKYTLSGAQATSAFVKLIRESDNAKKRPTITIK